jgi:hypothetical protein
MQMTSLDYDKKSGVKSYRRRKIKILRSVQTDRPMHDRKIKSLGATGYANNPSAPFGDIKSSGIDRKLGPEAREAFFYKKSIYSNSSVSRGSAHGHE